MAEKNMPFIIIATHGHFGAEMIKSAEMIIGKMQDVYAFSLIEGMDPMDLRAGMDEVLKDAPQGSMILTDLFGGTPCNMSATFSKLEKFTIVSGLNLPMLIEADALRSQNPPEDVSERLIQAGSSGMKDIVKLMKERGKR